MQTEKPLSSPSKEERDTLSKLQNINHSLVAECIESDFINGLQKTYAFAISIVEQHPQQVNNEIRNALTHLGRAIKATDDIVEAREEIAKAKGHFERAKKDCYKLAVIRLHERILENIALIEFTEGVINGTYKKRLQAIIKDREQAFIEETGNNTSGSSLLYHNVAMDLLDLEEQINNNYASPKTNTASIRRYFMTILIGNKKGTIYAVCGVLIASFLFSAFSLVAKVGPIILKALI